MGMMRFKYSYSVEFFGLLFMETWKNLLLESLFMSKMISISTEVLFFLLK